MPTLIYDEKCLYCRAVSQTAAYMSDIEILPYDTDKARKRIQDAFEEPGFTLYLFDDDRVYWGRQAAKKVAEKTAVPYTLLHPVIASYPYLVRLFSVLSSRAGVEQPECDSERCLANEEGGGMKKLY